LWNGSPWNKRNFPSGILAKRWNNEYNHSQFDLWPNEIPILFDLSYNFTCVSFLPRLHPTLLALTQTKKDFQLSWKKETIIIPCVYSFDLYKVLMIGSRTQPCFIYTTSLEFYNKYPCVHLKNPTSNSFPLHQSKNSANTADFVLPSSQ